MVDQHARRLRASCTCASDRSDGGGATAAAGLARGPTEVIEAFCAEVETPEGVLTTRALREDDTGPASVVLTRAFAGGSAGIPFDDGRRASPLVPRAAAHAACTHLRGRCRSL